MTSAPTIMIIMNITTTATNMIIKRLLLSSLALELPATPSVVIGTCVDTAGGTAIQCHTTVLIE